MTPTDPRVEQLARDIAAAYGDSVEGVIEKLNQALKASAEILVAGLNDAAERLRHAAALIAAEYAKAADDSSPGHIAATRAGCFHHVAAVPSTPYVSANRPTPRARAPPRARPP